MFLVVFISSCTKEDVEINTSSPIKLTIETVKVESGILNFKSIEQYNQVVQEIYSYSKEYEAYFRNTRPIESSFTKIDDFYQEFDHNMKEEEMLSLLRKHNIKPNSYQEVDYKMPFYNNNLLLNEESLISIDQSLWNVTITHKKEFKNLSHFRAYQNNNAEPLSTILRNINNSTTRTGGSCTQKLDKDQGFWCSSRRVKGENTWEIDDSFSQFPTPNSCPVFYIWELKTKYFIRHSLIWWTKNADIITLDGDLEIFNSMGGDEETCSFSLTESETNDWIVTDMNTFNCVSPRISDSRCEFPDYGVNHGVLSNSSTHTASEDDSCTESWNGFMSTTINCI